MYPKSAHLQSEGRPVVVYRAAAVRDGAGCRAEPGAVAIRRVGPGGPVVAAGTVETVQAAAGPGAKVVDLGDCLLLPGLVNAHCHLELTGIGYQPYGGDFIDWIKMVRSHWANPEDPMDPVNGHELARASVRGVELSRSAGVLTVGDQSRHAVVNAAVRRTGIRGVSYIELFGLGRPHDRLALEQIAQARPEPARARRLLGLHPHAPYSAGPAIYRAAADWPGPCSTHLAETRHEGRFVARADGPHRDLLVEMGRWEDRFADGYGRGLTPVQWMEPFLKCKRWALAHCNYLTDQDIALLARCGASVVYCPRASDYFEHSGHRYRQLMRAGVNVALGTDSIICHGTLSILDEMRYLHQRDGVAGSVLLAMATVNGMKALEMDPMEATFTPGAWPGLIAVSCRGGAGGDSLEAVLESTEAVRVQVLADAGRPGGPVEAQAGGAAGRTGGSGPAAVDW